MRKASVGANTVRPRGLVLWENCTGAYGIAGSCNDQCPGGALNRTSGPALLAGGHRFARQVLPYGCKMKIVPNLYVGTVGADSISARRCMRLTVLILDVIFHRFVGRGLDPSMGGNASPVRGVGDAAPYI